MKWPLFENKIKDELSGHRSEVDIDALWDAIGPEVDAINKSKRKKRFGAIWFLLAGTLLLGSGAAYYFLINNNDVKDAPSFSDGFINEKIDNGEERELNTNTNSNSNTAIDIAVEYKTGDSQETLNHSKYNADLENDNKPVKEKRETVSGIQPDKPIANAARKIASSPKLFIENPAKIQPVETPIKNSNIDKEPSSDRSFKPIQKVAALKILPLITKSITPNVRIPALKSVLAGNPTTPEQPDDKRHPMGKKGFHFSIAANGGISFSDRNLTANDSIGSDLMKLRERTEKQLETSHVGLQLNMRHKSGFEISSGLQYTRIVERFGYNENITTTDSVFGIAYYAVNPNNDTLAVMGMLPHTVHTDILKRYYNRYTMLDIPVLIGFYKENEGWVYGAQVGVFANISLKTKGRFLKNEKEDEDIKNLFKNKVGMSYYIGLTGGCKLNDKVEINISPYLRYFPNNFAKESYPISQKYMLIGLDARVRYWF